MRTALGVSAGSEVVGSVLLTTAPNGAQTTEYRVISADEEANTDLGELIASSIELMTTQLPSETIQPDGIAVAYRTKDQTQHIRSAVGSRRHDLQLVPETAAALTYLRSTGEVAQHETIALFDLGATGLTVTVIDQVDGTVHDSRRTDAVSGRKIDDLVCDYLLAEHFANDRTERPSSERLGAGTLLRRARAAKEHLSSSDAVTIDHVAGRPLKLTREEFDDLISAQCATATAFAKDVFDAAPHRPGIVAVIGGGGNIPAIHTALVDALDLPVLTVDEPEAVIAKGAALLADSAGPLAFPIVSMGTDAPIGTFTKVAGALIGAFVVVGLVIGYGVQALSPATDDTGSVSPAGTSSPQTTEQLVTTEPTTAAPIVSETGASFPTYESPGGSAPTTTIRHEAPRESYSSAEASSSTSTTTTTTTRTPVPTLRPAPDLPMIPWPEIQRFFPRPNTPAPSATATPTDESPQSEAPQPDGTESPTQDETSTETTEPATPLNRPDTGSSGG
ncbi:Hsp70 family protein [Antrihabitans sp. YC2-6]|uniref:Hsp70 family protein n=1 Tax=Antrihabitans sp. YC2-6 TaxID=2799498 RepID=UPI0018F700DA|nr:Hsp70 family protein [Antrihabitans sp. YC2-6]MBJ8347435.1 Hsp70 family protein [Antrihabitans sp. YC2-6]